MSNSAKWVIGIVVVVVVVVVLWFAFGQQPGILIPGLNLGN